MKKTISLVLAITMLFSAFNVSVFAEEISTIPSVVAEGFCGSSVFWNFDDTGTLTIGGTGEMYNYEHFGPYAPWHTYDIRNQIKSVVIKNGVTYIGANAFLECYNLETATIPNSVTSIGRAAFRDCTSLKTITIPDSVMSMDSGVFYDCENLTSVTFSDSMTYIPRNTFYNCCNLLSFTIPASVTGIDSEAFSGCFSLAEITIPESVTYIAYRAFYYCVELQKVNWNAKAATCNEPFVYAGTDGAGIEFVFGDSVEKIPSLLFYVEGTYGSPNVKSITIGENVTSIGDKAFSGCGYDKIYWNAKNVADFTLDSNIFYQSGCVDLVFGDTVEHIPANLFHVNEMLTQKPHVFSVTIGDGLKSVGDNAFYDCTGLKSITISDNATGLDSLDFCNTAYYNNESNWENGVIYIDNHLIKAKDTIDDFYEVRSGTKTIASSAFTNCTNLTSISIPNTVSSIGENAFSGCTNLTEVVTQCNTCASKYFEKSKLNLTHGSTGEWIVVKQPTCKDGLKTKNCLLCGAILQTETIPAIGVHTASDWIISTVATVSAPGKKYKKCTVCEIKLDTATIPQLKPTTPKVTTTNEFGGVQVKWNAVAGATKYVVFRRQGGYNTWVNVGTTTGNTFLDKNVKSGIYYVYSVRAYNNAGQYSDFISANTQTRKFMATPKLTTIYNHVNGLAIKWNAVAGVTKGYRVYRRGAGSTYWTYLGTTKNLYFIDNAVKNKSSEYFRYTVIADGDYHSKFDTTGLYLRRLANPTLNSAVSSKSGITVKWGAVKGTTGYYVYRKTANSTWTRVGTVGGTNNTTFLDKTAKKGTTYTYTVKAVYGATTSAYNAGISCKDKY